MSLIDEDSNKKDLIRIFGQISIHTPAGGATGGVSDEAVNFQISIHAPAGGATVA